MVRPIAVDQIIDWKSRRGRSRQGFELIHHLEVLERNWRESQPDIKAFADFVPIRIATIIEVFVRESVREIIDTGPPYLQRAENLFKGLKIDFLFAANLHGQHLTIGDIAAHSISANEIGQITAIFEKLLPSYRDALPNVYDRWSVEVENLPEKPIIEDISATYRILDRLFEVRHILTHEIPRTATYEIGEVDSFLETSRHFLQATDAYITRTLRGDIPLTQMEMNQSVSGKLEVELFSLSEIYKKVSNLQDVDTDLLAASHKKWEDFADSEANLHAALVEGGSMYPMIWGEAKLELVRERSKQLQWWLDREEGDL